MKCLIMQKQGKQKNYVREQEVTISLGRQFQSATVLEKYEYLTNYWQMEFENIHWWLLLVQFLRNGSRTLNYPCKLNHSFIMA